MQRCQYCGTEFPDNSRFCSKCGRPPIPNAALPGASSSADTNFQPFVSPPVGNQPNAAGSFAGGQVPQVQGAPSLSGVPSVQESWSNITGPVSPSTPSQVGPAASAPPSTAFQPGNTPSMPPASAPPGAAAAGQPGMFEQRMPVSNNAPAAQYAGAPGVQYQKPPGQDHRPQQRSQKPGEYPGRQIVSKLVAGGNRRLILIAIIVLLVLAGGALALALRSQSPGPAGTTPVTTSRSTPASTNHKGTVTASPTAGRDHATGAFNFTGAIPGHMVISSLPQCGVRNGTYVMQVKGKIGGAQYTFLIGIVSYHGPGTYTSHLTVNLIKVGSFVSMNNNGSLPVTVTVTNNGKAGTISSDLIGLVSSTQIQPSTGHVSGSWTCV